MDGKASAIARNIRNCAATNLVGGWERATIPPLFSRRRSAAYWGDLSCAGGAAVFVGLAHSIFPNFVEIIFLLNSIAICLLSTSASLHYWCTPRLHSGGVPTVDYPTQLLFLGSCLSRHPMYWSQNSNDIFIRLARLHVAWCKNGSVLWKISAGKRKLLMKRRGVLIKNNKNSKRDIVGRSLHSSQ